MRDLATLLLVLICVVSIFAIRHQALAADKDEHFAVYYSDLASPEDFASFNLIVLDRDHHPELQPLLEHGKILLSYLSLGEVKETDSYYPELKEKGMVLAENPNWKGSYYIDIRNPAWSKMVLEELIPSTLGEKFSGIFFDTLDSSIYLEDSEPAKYPGMKDAAVHLIEAVRLHYPAMPIMVNRGYGLLPRIGHLIDKELGESVYADYNFTTKKYGKVDAETYALQLKWLNEAKTKNPNLKIYTLDYANPDDTKAIKNIYSTERANGFIPYVATVELDRLVPEPQP